METLNFYVFSKNFISKKITAFKVFFFFLNIRGNMKEEIPHGKCCSNGNIAAIFITYEFHRLF